MSKPVTFMDVFAKAKAKAPQKIVASPMAGMMGAATAAVDAGVKPPKIRSHCCGKVIR